MPDHHPLIVFSHLRWDWVYQRPQHLLSRFARTNPVHFIEEPLVGSGPASWEVQSPEPNVKVWKPRTPEGKGGFSREQIPILRTLMREFLESERITDCIAWFYTPLAIPLLDTLKTSCVVYDCMDELTGFKNAPPELFRAEEELFSVADVVFTGGPSLYKSKQDRHGNVHCFPSSVDRAHFGQARETLADPADQAPAGRPRLGYFGVIDERMDLDLIDALARSKPEWQIIMVGPVTKIDPGALPQRANIHYLGQKQYAELPAYLAGWNVCLLPFALNHATKYISPTKTLEYMAAGKPTVSTPITDVVEPYSDVVRIGRTSAEFIASCQAALHESTAERRKREARTRQILENTSWDSTVARMSKELAKVMQGGSSDSRVEPMPNAPRLRSGRESWPIVIVGAGPTGLSAAYHAGRDALLLEQNSSVGGWCRSIQKDGFTWDYAGHIMFSNDPYVHEMYRTLLGDNVHWQEREAWIYSHDVYTRYPFQGSLYGLPADVIKECLVGAVEARFGALKKRDDEECKEIGLSRCATGDVKDCCADGVLESTLTRNGRLRNASGASSVSGGNGERLSTTPESFEDFIYKVWGWGIAKHFAIPYNRKLWGVPLSEMETSWLGGRVPLPDLEEMIEGALKPTPRPMGPNARFGYPLRGGFQALMNGFLPYVRDRLRLNTGVKAISVKQQTLTLSDGKKLGFDHLISTMPLPVLVRCLGDEAPPSIVKAANALRYVSVRCVNLGIGRENLTEKHWIYYPEDTIFHRIFVQGNASPHCNAPGGFGLTCEITYSPLKPLHYDGDALIQKCIDDCRRVEIFRQDDSVWSSNQVDLPHAYVVYDHARAANVKLIRDWFSGHNIVLAGRYSEWQYYNSDHAFLAGKKAVESVQASRKPMAEAIA